jgi:flagellar basal-body rod protein FlgG
MIRALYTAASGMMVESQKLDVLTNNLANGQTPGFKALDLVRASQAARPAVPRSDIQTAFAEQFHNPTPGQLRPTGVPFDFALEGDGYFAVETKGGTAYTRNGHFRRHADGRLTDGADNPVLGQKGPIRLPSTADVTIAEDGTLFADSKRVDRLKIVGFADDRTLRSAGASLLYPTAAATPETPDARVVGQTLEDSNVSTVSEMARMVEATRAFESYQKVIQTVMDDITGAAVNRFGRVA